MITITWKHTADGEYKPVVNGELSRSVRVFRRDETPSGYYGRWKTCGLWFSYKKEACAYAEKILRTKAEKEEGTR
jgi:hypothetical protein